MKDERKKPDMNKIYSFNKRCPKCHNRTIEKGKCSNCDYREE